MMKRILLMGLSAMSVALLVCAVETTEQAAKELKPDRNMERAAHDLAQNLPEMHLSRMPFDEHVATNAVKMYIDMLDFEHCYFLTSDIAGFEKEGTNIAAEVADGNLDFAYHVFNVFLDRVSNRVAYVNQLISGKFDLTKDETYLWKRKDAPWSKDQAEWDDLWRKRIKNQFVAKKVSDALGTNTTDAIEKAENGNEAPTHSESADAKMKPEEGIRKGYERFYTVLKDNDAQWVAERYLNAFTMCYDPHTAYMAPESQEDFEISMNLSLVGIGALLGPEDGAAKVERLIPGGPAERDGRLKPGDKIVAVGQGDEPLVDILHLPLNKAVKMIRGKKDTKVVLKYIPATDPSGASTKSISLIRDEVKIEESAAKGDVREITTKGGSKFTFGVITLPEFYADMRQGKKADTEPRFCSRDCAKILADLKKQDVEGIILDLRSNGGGSLSEAINVAALFLPPGPVVLVKDQQRIQALTEEGSKVSYAGPLIVLVNRFSASASEIVAAALQDYGRAIVIGDSKTHGKGTVQSLTPLSPTRKALGSLKVTTASFYRITGGTTQIKGVVPDIVIPSTVDALDVGEDSLQHALQCPPIGPVQFAREDKYSAILPKLRIDSESRRATDSKFAVLNDLIQRLKKQQQSKEITLKFDDRLKLAKDEQALQKLLDENDPTKEQKDNGAKAGTPDQARTDPHATDQAATAKDKPKDAKKKTGDLVLNETLNILADWVGSSESKATSTAKTDPGHI